MVQAPGQRSTKTVLFAILNVWIMTLFYFDTMYSKFKKSEKVKCGLTTISHSQGRNIYFKKNLLSCIFFIYTNVYRARFLNNINKCITAAAHNSGPATWRFSPNDPGT